MATHKAVVIKSKNVFCFRLNEDASETLALVKVIYKDNALLKVQVFWLFNEFKNERKTVEDMERSGYFPVILTKIWRLFSVPKAQENSKRSSFLKYSGHSTCYHSISKRSYSSSLPGSLYSVKIAWTVVYTSKEITLKNIIDIYWLDQYILFIILNLCVWLNINLIIGSQGK